VRRAARRVVAAARVLADRAPETEGVA
jgi:hypothetical protein